LKILTALPFAVTVIPSTWMEWLWYISAKNSIVFVSNGYYTRTFLLNLRIQGRHADPMRFKAVFQVPLLLEILSRWQVAPQLWNAGRG
jgi:hypothetical protein